MSRFYGSESRAMAWRCFRDPIHLAILVEHRLVTDGQTDGRTQGHSIYRASTASRGKIR